MDSSLPGNHAQNYCQVFSTFCQGLNTAKAMADPDTQKILTNNGTVQMLWDQP
uniref:Uncharacterized protein n=1 Tax=Anguilla anguilla TaxID=7936 RepID=A0A0E9VQU9_ANGAN